MFVNALGNLQIDPFPSMRVAHSLDVVVLLCVCVCLLNLGRIHVETNGMFVHMATHGDTRAHAVEAEAMMMITALMSNCTTL